MPAKPSWLLRIPEILKLLSALHAPVIDRATCEQLFGVRRRRAIDLLHRFGAYTAGNTVLVDRLELMRYLDGLRIDPDLVQESARRKRVSGHIDELRQQSIAAAVVIPHAERIHGHKRWAPPDGTSVEPGKLVVEFTDDGELLSRLYSLAQRMAADYDGFLTAVRLPSAPDKTKHHGRAR
jgi:hypothetical protein